MMLQSCSNPPSRYSQCSVDCHVFFVSLCLLYHFKKRGKYYCAALEMPTLLSALLTQKHDVSSRVFPSWAEWVLSQGFRSTLLKWCHARDGHRLQQSPTLVLFALFGLFGSSACLDWFWTLQTLCTVTQYWCSGTLGLFLTRKLTWQQVAKAFCWHKMESRTAWLGMQGVGRSDGKHTGCIQHGVWERTEWFGKGRKGLHGWWGWIRSCPPLSVWTVLLLSLLLLLLLLYELVCMHINKGMHGTESAWLQSTWRKTSLAFRKWF